MGLCGSCTGLLVLWVTHGVDDMYVPKGSVPVGGCCPCCCLHGHAEVPVPLAWLCGGSGCQRCGCMTSWCLGDVCPQESLRQQMAMRQLVALVTPMFLQAVGGCCLKGLLALLTLVSPQASWQQVASASAGTGVAVGGVPVALVTPVSPWQAPWQRVAAVPAGAGGRSLAVPPGHGPPAPRGLLGDPELLHPCTRHPRGEGLGLGRAGGLGPGQARRCPVVLGRAESRRRRAALS